MDEPDNQRVDGAGLALLSWPDRSDVGDVTSERPTDRAWGRNPGPLQAISLP